MKGLELKLIFKNSKAYLTNDNSITIQEQSLNNYVKNFNSVAYWTIRVKGYFEDEKRIFCEVLLYQNGKSDFDYTQKQISDKLNLLQKISFNKISTQGLLSTIGKSNRNSRQYNTFKPVDKPIRIPEFEPIEKKPVIQNINETFYVPIKDVNFKLGSVSFERKFRGYNKIIQLEIPNYDIKEEYDAIKNYFANILKTKKIQVTVNINIVDHEITKQNVYSQEINRINKQLIDEVKFNILKSATKSKMDSEKENNLFTVEEYFKELINDEFDTTTFFNNDEEFLNDIIKIVYPLNVHWL